MIAFEQALEHVVAACARLPSEREALERAIGRVSAEALHSPVDLPPFDNSAMDGFALRTDGGPVEAGTRLRVHGEQAAGDGERSASGEGAWSIMTGARVPDGLDAIVPVEHVEVLERDAAGRPLRIELAMPVRPGQNLRRTAEDIGRGQLALPAGHRIGAAEIMLLAGLGIGHVEVVRRPRVALLCTGRELVDDFEQPLAPGQIRNSNAPFLAARLAAAGAALVQRETLPDEPERFAVALDRAVDGGVDIVVSTGAVSMGRFDFVPGVLRDAGADIVFHKVAMRPGKPLLFARLANGALFFGLPGNPVSSAVGLRFFVEPALRAMLGLPREQGWRVPLLHAIGKKPGFRLHQKARVRLDGEGRLGVELLQGQESFRTKPLVESTAWAALPAGAEALRPGDPVEVYALGHESGIALEPNQYGASVA